MTQRGLSQPRSIRDLWMSSMKQAVEWKLTPLGLTGTRSKSETVVTAARESASVEDAIRLRDAALRELAERFHRTLSVSSQAQEVRRRALRYAASAWRFDRERGAMPPRYDGTQTKYLWRAFKSGAAMPLNELQLRNILAH